MAANNEAQRAWVLKVLGVDTATGATVGDDGDDDTFDLDAPNRLAAAARQLDALKAEGDPALPTLLALQTAAATASQAQAPDLADRLDALEAALARATSAARGRAAGRDSKGAVEYAKLLLRWHDAQAKVDENLRALGKAILADPEIIEDPAFDEIKDAVDDLPDLVPDLGSQLDDILDEARKPTADKEQLHREALAVLSQYRKRLGAVSALQELEGFAKQTSASSISLFREFSSAFNELEAELSKAV